MDQQGAQVAITMFARSKQTIAAATRSLLGHSPEPREELLFFVTMLKANNRVVRVSHDNHVAGGTSPPRLADLLIIDMMEVNVCQERANDRALRRSLLRLRLGVHLRARQPMLPNKPCGVRRNDRRVLNSIFWVLRSGAPWRDLPENYGPRTTCYNRFVRWRRAGVWITSWMHWQPGMTRRCK